MGETTKVKAEKIRFFTTKENRWQREKNFMHAWPTRFFYFYSKQFYGVIFQQSSVRVGLKYPGPSEMIYGASISNKDCLFYT